MYYHNNGNSGDRKLCFSNCNSVNKENRMDEKDKNGWMFIFTEGIFT